MIDEKVLIEHIKHHKDTVYPSHAMAAEVYGLAHDHFIDMVNIQPKVGGWIPCSERMPHKRDWYLAVFKEIDTNFVLIPKIADFLMGKHTEYTTEDGWVIADCTDTETERDNYYKKLKCIAWMPLPEPYDANAEAEKPQWQQNMMDRFLKGE